MEIKTVRLAWNTNGWIKPSGKNGKPKFNPNKNYNSFEAENGYGHEEWLFNMRKVIKKDVQYGFLQPINFGINNYMENEYIIYLYTINDLTKERYFVGKINKLTVLNEQEAKIVVGIYRKEKWLNEMEHQIIDVEGKVETFKKLDGIKLFNVKFNIEDLVLNDPMIKLPKENRVYNIHRYVLNEYENEFEQVISRERRKEFTPSEPTPKKGKRKKYIVEPKSIQSSDVHDQIGHSLYKYLSNKYGKRKIAYEQQTKYGTRIDLVLKKNNIYSYYEIKAYPTIKASIREAVGQLIEYCYYPNVKNADELIIVSNITINNNDEISIYLKHLRNILGINVYYQYIDLENNVLSEKY
jgi:hypothetical protein